MLLRRALGGTAEKHQDQNEKRTAADAVTGQNAGRRRSQERKKPRNCRHYRLNTIFTPAYMINAPRIRRSHTAENLSNVSPAATPPTRPPAR